jgi:hypothetical protein
MPVYFRFYQKTSSIKFRLFPLSWTQQSKQLKANPQTRRTSSNFPNTFYHILSLLNHFIYLKIHKKKEHLLILFSINRNISSLLSVAHLATREPIPSKMHDATTSTSQASKPVSSPPSPRQVADTEPASPVSSTSSLHSDVSSVLIVGGGNFGAATALSLARKGGVKVTVVDTVAYPNPRAASHDINKIVRDDYPDKLYMRMLIKAMPMWRADKLYSPWYHEVGMLRADASDFGEKSVASYKAVGVASDAGFLSVDEVRKRWNGAYATANFGTLDKILYNPTVGYAEADKALNAVMQAAVDLGVEYVVGEMKSLDLGADGRCVGIELTNGQTLRADKILLCTGARTGTLLAQSAPENKKLHIGDRLVATGAVSFTSKLHGEQKEKFASIPVLKNCLPEVKGALYREMLDFLIDPPSLSPPPKMINKDSTPSVMSTSVPRHTKKRKRKKKRRTIG